VTAVETETPQETDYALAQKAAQADMAAFELLYQRHNRRVYSLCLRMTSNVSEAEDLAQEVFIQLFRKIGSSFEKLVAFVVNRLLPLGCTG
jgi:DNA-directed RNA polymerase specialized sigma24 family protein